MPVSRISREQHPHAVARAVVQLAAREAYRHTAELRGAALEALAPIVRELTFPHDDARDDAAVTGSWVPFVLHQWARSVLFVREPGALGEVLVSARKTVATRMGDCDDVALAVAAMAMTFGTRATVAVRWQGPGLAHMAAVVAADWLGAPPLFVVDPQLECVATLERGSPWHFGRVLPEVTPGPAA